MGDGFRFTAVGCWIKDILESSFVNTAEGPSKIVLKNNKEVGRVNVLGTVTALVKDVPFRFVVDDGTGQIEVIDFEKKRDLKVGDFIRIVGLPKEYLGSKYVILEILKKTDPLWLKLKLKSVSSEMKDWKEDVLSFVKKNDEGFGVSFENIEEVVGEEAEKTINFLLEKGFLFEIKPGFVKVLE